MEYKAAPEGSRNSKNSWEDDELTPDNYTTSQFERVNGKGGHASAPEFVQHETTAASARRSTGFWPIFLGAVGVVGALALGIWGYSWFAEQENDNNAAPMTTTRVIAPEPASSLPNATSSSASFTTTALPTKFATPTRAAAHTTITFESTESQSTSVTSEPTPSSVGTTSTSVSEEYTFRAPENAVQCAANVNWRIFTSGQDECGFAKDVAIAMAGNSGIDGQHEVVVDKQSSGEQATVTCAWEGANSYTCNGGGATVVLEDRAVRD
ncbi:hypothetical protein QP027_05055 [Corynebacterium breve]|uniref:Uncharacterized protein n=1 Tax=Corynebacterium breve TaxID=3049799 RepID=A0ABY8VHE5_9CORY|nr:hypothetical protein [Corynebacterium breve]WIM68757.1 hypothetical protein QP027_05055 [Corynebacterium breve]